jgi:predicted nucleic acid-binding protein
MPRDSTFLDTSGWISLLNATDARHALAVAAWREARARGVRYVVTDWVIAETGNGLARDPIRPRFAESVRRLLQSPHARLIFVEGELLGRALDLYEARADKTWGLVDCASILVMQDEGIRDVFGNDRHFAQAGFRCLLPTA